MPIKQAVLRFKNQIAKQKIKSIPIRLQNFMWYLSYRPMLKEEKCITIVLLDTVHFSHFTFTM